MSAVTADIATRSAPLWLVGASGLLAGELMRLLEMHPVLRLAGAVSRSGGTDVGEMHPHLATGTVTTTTGEAAGQIRESLQSNPEEPHVLVLGLPHGESAAFWCELRSELGPDADRVHVVDLSADYRLRDRDVYAHWYGREHADPDELTNFTYGLAEWKRDAIARSKRVAAPGCFATALQLATLPAARAGVLDPSRPWVLNAITGSSGSGNSPKPGTHHPHRHGNLWAYGVGGHRHEAELRQSLSDAGIEPTSLHFLPHSGPFVRGIHLTAFLPLASELESADARAIYSDAYECATFIEIVESGVPDLRRVAGSNRVALSTHVQNGGLTVLLTLDNVIKGGAGQALQCLNLMLGLPEPLGLPQAGLGVV